MSNIAPYSELFDDLVPALHIHLDFVVVVMAVIVVAMTVVVGFVVGFVAVVGRHYSQPTIEKDCTADDDEGDSSIGDADFGDDAVDVDVEIVAVVVELGGDVDDDDYGDAVEGVEAAANGCDSVVVEVAYYRYCGIHLALGLMHHQSFSLEELRTQLKECCYKECTCPNAGTQLLPPGAEQQVRSNHIEHPQESDILLGLLAGDIGRSMKTNRKQSRQRHVQGQRQRQGQMTGQLGCEGYPWEWL
jgi:hypothetical protein